MDNFLNELWHNTAENEVGEIPADELASEEMQIERYDKTSGVKIYKLIKKQAESDEVAKGLLKSLNENIIRYYKAIAELERLTAMYKDNIEQFSLSLCASES